MSIKLKVPAEILGHWSRIVVSVERREEKIRIGVALLGHAEINQQSTIRKTGVPQTRLRKSRILRTRLEAVRLFRSHQQ
jgi:hypothetical protein